MLNVTLLLRAIADCANEGYNYVGISGGEPLLYPHLRELLLQAKTHGMSTAVATNGMLLNATRVEQLIGAADTVAISVDGTPESHNRMRNSARAYDKMQANLIHLRNAAIPFGFIFTLTQHNLDELPAVADFAVNEGATLLQIHPLEPTGYASDNLSDKSPDTTECAYAWLLASQLQKKFQGRLRINIDLLYSEALKSDPDRVYAGEVTPDRPFAELVSPLVIEADGAVVPMLHGFDRHYAIGNLADAPLQQAFNDWRDTRLSAFSRVCKDAFKRIERATQPHFLNWYELVGQCAITDVSDVRKAEATQRPVASAASLSCDQEKHYVTATV